jgi:hypothetical protein
MANNGHDPTRLDRLESLVETLAVRRLEFEQEYKRLQITQVMLTDRIDQSLDRLAELQAEGARRMKALVSIVDEIIRKRPPSASA